MTDDQIHLETTSIVSVITISHRALFNNSPVSPLHLRQAPGRRGPLIAAPRCPRQAISCPSAGYSSSTAVLASAQPRPEPGMTQLVTHPQVTGPGVTHPLWALLTLCHLKHSAAGGERLLLLQCKQGHNGIKFKPILAFF